MHEMNRSQISEEKWEAAGTERENKTASAGENKSTQF